eukprot:1155402-Pelagomonas_calceolata.AAC.4
MPPTPTVTVVHISTPGLPILVPRGPEGCAYRCAQGSRYLSLEALRDVLKDVLRAPDTCP